jgi:hypothetical protein
MFKLWYNPLYQRKETPMAYKTGNKMQTVLLPPIIDDYVSKEDPVRVYDAFVEALDFNQLGISLTDYKAGAE